MEYFDNSFRFVHQNLGARLKNVFSGKEEKEKSADGAKKTADVMKITDDLLRTDIDGQKVILNTLPRTQLEEIDAETHERATSMLEQRIAAENFLKEKASRLAEASEIPANLSEIVWQIGMLSGLDNVAFEYYGESDEYSNESYKKTLQLQLSLLSLNVKSRADKLKQLFKIKNPGNVRTAEKQISDDSTTNNLQNILVKPYEELSYKELIFEIQKKLKLEGLDKKHPNEFPNPLYPPVTDSANLD